MAQHRNSMYDVFKKIDMTGGPDACWPWKDPVRGSKGRPYFDFDGKKHIAYRFVYQLYHAREVPSSIMLRHTCDNKVCCNPRHLVEGSHQQNMDDMKERERHGLPHHTVRYIKRLLRENMLTGSPTHQEIADRFGVSRETVTAINNGRVYQHVGPDDEA